MTLDQLPYNKIVTVTGLVENNLSNKLTEMGIFPGQQLKVVFKAPFGDPIAVEMEGYTLSLRKNEAQLIQIM